MSFFSLWSRIITGLSFKVKSYLISKRGCGRIREESTLAFRNKKKMEYIMYFC
jgi:hypothetical protein